MKNITKLTLTLLILNTLYLIPLTAQVGINNDNSEPDASAMLDVKSDNKGMLVPRMSSSQRTMISNAATGLLVFDTDTESFWFKSSTVWIELVDELSPMEHDAANNLVKPNEEVVDLATDDFVFGSPQLDDTGDPDNDYRFFFDKSKGAFRAGRVEDTEWDESNLGNQSVAFGSRTTANGNQSVALGRDSESNGNQSVAIGNGLISTGNQSVAMGNAAVSTGNQSGAIGNRTEATGNQSIAMGNRTKSTGSQSIAMGDETKATANESIAMGNRTKASASSALAVGNRTQAISFAEAALGTYNTLYTFTDSLSWNTNDRLFVIGNGLDEDSRSDAFSILKNGNIALNGTVTIDSAYTLPSADGSMGQILTTDGSGTANWTSNTLLQDADGDTKIQVEESVDEDVIRFDLEGQERMTLSKDGIGQTILSLPNDSRVTTKSIETSGGSLILSALGWGMNFSIDEDANSGDRYTWSSDNTVIATLNQNGDLNIDGTLTENSDLRLKKDIQLIQNPLEKLNAINGYTYYWKGRPDTSLQVGVIAQEVQAVLPQLVTEDEEGIKSVNYTKLSAVLIEAMKVQQTEISQLKSEINELKAQNARIQQLEQQMAQLLSQSNEDNSTTANTSEEK